MKIINDFLPVGTADLIEKTLLGPDVPFYFATSKTDWNDETPDNYQFIHTFCINHFIASGLFDPIIRPFIDRLEIDAIVRIKANLNPYMGSHCVDVFHSDHPNCQTAIYYVNSNNGYTLFETGEKVESVKNRIVTFDSNLKHAGVTCTDQKARVVLNFNFYKRTKL